MDEDYVMSEEYAEEGFEVMRQRLPELLNAQVSIGFLKSFKKKRKGPKVVFGECKKVPDIWKVYCPHDFVIIVYELNCVEAEFTDEQYKILLWHELKHVGIDEKGNFYVEPHDFEDFNEIYKEHGLHWSSN